MRSFPLATFLEQRDRSLECANHYRGQSACQSWTIADVQMGRTFGHIPLQTLQNAFFSVALEITSDCPRKKPPWCVISLIWFIVGDVSHDARMQKSSTNIYNLGGIIVGNARFIFTLGWYSNFGRFNITILLIFIDKGSGNATRHCGNGIRNAPKAECGFRFETCTENILSLQKSCFGNGNWIVSEIVLLIFSLIFKVLGQDQRRYRLNGFQAPANLLDLLQKVPFDYTWDFQTIMQ